MTRRARNLLIAGIAVLAIPVTAAGAGLATGPDDPVGSPDNPIVAPEPDAAAAARAKARGHANEARAPLTPAPAQQELQPCALVSEGEAREIFGETPKRPVEAPLGPTCVYRAQSHEDFVTVSLQTSDETQRKQRVAGADKVDVDGRTGYCGPSEQEMTLSVPLPGERMLVVGGACDVGRKFAIKAMARIAP